MNKNWLPQGNHWGLKISHNPRFTGSMAGGGHKIVWHTTEGGFNGADVTVRRAGVEPHFLIDPVSGKVIQYIPLDNYAKCLKHPGGTPETNRANAIQIEIAGYAARAGSFTNGQLRKLAALACLIDHRFDIPRKAPFAFAPGHRVSGSAFYRASGHVGHMHCPHNDHVDPGRLNIRRVFSHMHELENAK